MSDNKNSKSLVVIGVLITALLIFIGSMLFYFVNNDMASKNKEQRLKEIWKSETVTTDDLLFFFENAR